MRMPCRCRTWPSSCASTPTITSVSPFTSSISSSVITIVPPGSPENASFRMVISYWDMVASFIVSGVLNKELFFQSGRELLVVFERLRVVLPGIREAYKDPSYMHNLERVGLDFSVYMQAQHPDAYPAFVKRITG